jgi:ELWxxDGT repeat protein
MRNLIFREEKRIMTLLTRVHPMTMGASLLIFAASALTNANASSPRLVRDINAVGMGISSAPTLFSDQGAWSMFFADDGTHGNQPWVTHGTAMGTFAWGPVIPGTAGGGVPIRAMGKTYLFQFSPQTSGSIWISDGTPSGTSLVGNAINEPNWNNMAPEVAFGSSAIFSAANSSTGARELWLSDGVHASIHLSSSSGEAYNVINSVVANGHIFFLATNSDGSYEPWISDGTTAGTARLGMIPQVAPDPGRPRAAELVQVGNFLIFSAYTGTAGRELWRIDLSTNAVSQVANIAAGTSSGVAPNSVFCALGSIAIFSAAADGTNWVLWRTDGTPAGTFQLASVAPDPNFSYVKAPGSQRTLFGVFTGAVEQLWATDGSVQGTVQLPFSGAPDQVYPVGSNYYLTASSPSGNQLWRTDGTVSGSSPLAGIPASLHFASQFAGDDTKVFVSSDDASGASGSLFVYDPQGRTSKQISRYARTVSQAFSYIFDYAQGMLFFDNEDPSTGEELWISDGTSAGTQILKNIAPETQTRASNPQNFAEYANLLYFSADDGIHGRELWRSDGTNVGTQLVADLNPGAGDSNPTNLFVSNGKLYFFALDNSGTFKFWQSDGTAAGTLLLATLAPTPLPACAPSGVSIGNVTYFSGYDPLLGSQLWRTDGSVAGTFRVSNIAINAGVSQGLCSLIAFNGNVYFDAGGPSVTYNNLWKSDGTAAGTISLTGSNQTNLAPSFFATNGSELYFRGTDATLVGQLWRTDGTVLGTEPVSLANVSGATGVYGSVGGKILFRTAGNTQAHPSQFWVTDGTSANSLQVGPDMAIAMDAFVNHGIGYVAGQLPTGSEPTGEVLATDGTAAGTHDVFPIEGDFAFVAGTFADFRGQTMFQIQVQTQAQSSFVWIRTDGTAAGTQDTNATSTGTAWGEAGQNFFYVGNDGSTGNELWVLSNDPPLAMDDNMGSVVAGASITANLLANDLDPDGSLDPSSLRILTQPSGGIVSIGTGGAVTYTANAGFTGADSFTYAVADMQGLNSLPAAAQVSVTAVVPSGGGSIPSSGNGGGGGGTISWFELLILTCLASTSYFTGHRDRHARRAYIRR